MRVDLSEALSEGVVNTETLIDTYCRAWSDADPTERARTLRLVWGEGATYTDPSVHAIGDEAVLAHIGRVIAKRPGSRVIRTSRIDVHHNVARFAWCAIESNGTALPEGIDIAFLRADGSKIEKIVGFFGPLQRV